MKKINYLFLIILGFMFSISSCKKDEPSPSYTSSILEKQTEVLTGTTWKISSRIDYDVSVTIQDCEKDDFFTFTKDGIYTHNVGTLICDGETNSSGTWNLSFNVFTFDGNPMYIDLSKSQMVLTQGDMDGTILQLTFIPM